ncbi:cupin domain-containing protein [Streptomyces sp. NPDC051218]|uniref:cupin domain-containing protein n=1 Tax=Streptomyces sp. NPDC051218 TaxID=3365645 RepID=UPI00378B5A6F
MAAKSPGPSTHFHKWISESFFVLSGQVQLYDGDRWITGGPGDFLYVPVGGLSHRAPRARSTSNRWAETAQKGGKEFGEFLVKHDSFFVDR